MDVGRLRNLFHVGASSLSLPLMAIIDPGHRTAWLVATGASLVGTVVSIGVLLNTTSGLKRRADSAELDATSGLLNADSLVRAIDGRNVADGALVIFDIDNFGDLNQTIGRSKCDEVVRLVADRVVEGTRGSDIAARVGPDSFAVVLDGIQDDYAASEIATRLLGSFFEPANIGGLELDISATVGLSLLDHGATNRAEGAAVLQQATMALEVAKRTAKPLEVFRAEHRRHSDEALAMVTQVHHGLENQEFEAYLQPIVDNWNGRTIGVEALVRWNHPERGVVPPALFLKQIENLPVGREFAHYMLRHSLTALAALGNRHVSLSVNLGFRDVEDLNLPLVVRELLEEFGISPRRLTLEVPESVGTRRRDRTELVLTQIRDMGCGIAIDDFGGSSVPMDFLATLPVTELKIAPKFVQGCMDDSTSRRVIGHIVGLAHGAGLRATAKGVERQAVLESLIDLGCDASQGYHFAHPMPVQDMIAWLENDRVFI